MNETWCQMSVSTTVQNAIVGSPSQLTGLMPTRPMA